MAKYKIKTHKGAQKRIGISGSGKLMRAKGLQSHLRRKKPARTRRMYSEMFPIAKADVRRLRRTLPNGV